MNILFLVAVIVTVCAGFVAQVIYGKSRYGIGYTHPEVYSACGAVSAFCWAIAFGFVYFVQSNEPLAGPVFLFFSLLFVAFLVHTIVVWYSHTRQPPMPDDQ